MTSEEPPRLPERLFRVVADVGYGYPKCRYRERQARNFARADTAARWIENLSHWPEHHSLVGVWVADTYWRPVDPDALKPPPREPDENR